MRSRSTATTSSGSGCSGATSEGRSAATSRSASTTSSCASTTRSSSASRWVARSRGRSGTACREAASRRRTTTSCTSRLRSTTRPPTRTWRCACRSGPARGSCRQPSPTRPPRRPPAWATTWWPASRRSRSMVRTAGRSPRRRRAAGASSCAGRAVPTTRSRARGQSWARWPGAHTAAPSRTSTSHPSWRSSRSGAQPGASKPASREHWKRS